jgi:hypothetical protein
MRNRERSAGPTLLGWLLIGTAVVALPACEERNSRFEEAVEEVEDEAQDARDEVRDEVDDNS